MNDYHTFQSFPSLVLIHAARLTLCLFIISWKAYNVIQKQNIKLKTRNSKLSLRNLGHSHLGARLPNWYMLSLVVILNKKSLFTYFFFS
jgi:hypothetical protein